MTRKQYEQLTAPTNQTDRQDDMGMYLETQLSDTVIAENWNRCIIRRNFSVT